MSGTYTQGDRVYGVEYSVLGYINVQGVLGVTLLVGLFTAALEEPSFLFVDLLVFSRTTLEYFPGYLSTLEKLFTIANRQEVQYIFKYPLGRVPYQILMC